MTPSEASDFVTATCNLGLENWPAGWREPDFVTAFKVGWVVLHRDLCGSATSALIDALTGLSCSDRDTHWALQTLRRELIAHRRAGRPWRAREALDAILALDPAAWALLRTFIDECPAIHPALTASRPARSIDPTAFVFAASNAEIDRARQWLASLATALTG